MTFDPDGPYILPQHEQLVRDLRAKRRAVVIPESPLFTGTLRPDQHLGVGVMYLTPKIILGDVTGLGKTVQVLRLLALLVERQEVTSATPAFVLVPAKSIRMTWERDGFEVFTPLIPTAVLDGTTRPAARREVYEAGQQLIYCLNYNVFMRDVDVLIDMFPARHIVACDEAHEFRHHSTRTAAAVKRFCDGVPRVVPITASAINTALADIHSPLEAMGLTHIFGTLPDFRREYENSYVAERHIRGRRIRIRVQDENIPYRNLDQFKRLVWPYYLRRTFAELPPGTMPAFEHTTVPIGLGARQRRVYEDLRHRQLPEPGQGRRFKLQARIQYMQQVATGLQTINPQWPDESSKLDWLMRELRNDLSDGGYYLNGASWVQGCPVKVVVFSFYKATIMTLMRRLREANIGAVVMAGKGDLPDESEFPYGTTPNERSEFRDIFFHDPECQVLIGTTAIDMSLNLQAAPLLVNLDLLPNPARMEQLAGRIIRANSPWSFVRALSLVTTGTIEEGRLALLAKRQGLINEINEEEGIMYQALTEEDLEQLILHQW